jgi:signal transduction histidine kinase
MLFCPWEKALYFVYSSNIPTLFFYSHIPAIIIALILGIFILRSGHRSPISIALFSITILFSIWCIFDLILWATNDPRNVMFFWSLQVLIEPLIYATCIYITFLFIKGRDMLFSGKLLMSVLLLPFIIFLSNKLNLLGVNLSDCTAVEGPVSLYYAYIYEIISAIVILEIFVSAYTKITDSSRKKEITYFIIGMIMFLLAFSWGNLIGSFTENWTIAQAGLIGMPIFFAFLAYISVKFKTFNLKILGAQVLVFALGFLVLSMSFVRSIQNIKIIIFFTLAFVIALGYQLIRGVKTEVKQRERLEVLRLKLEETNIKLEDANDKLKDLDKLKTEFLSLASHQLRSPLTAIKGYTSMVLEGDFGELNDKAKEAIERVFQSTMNLTKVVEDLLNVSKIEQGGMKFVMEDFSLVEIARDMSKDLSISAEKKGLKLTFEGDKDEDCMVNGDKEKLRQVVLNLIDNSIKYTKEGSVNVSVKRVSDKVVFSVKDTGMGMTPEIKATLFQKFSRGEGSRMNTGGSGLGLYLAKEIMEAHKGTIDVDSEGMGKGSNFHFELNAIKK